MIILTKLKQPWERKDYDVDASQWLAAGDSIVSAETPIVVCATDVTDTALVVETPIVSSPFIKLWISAGTNKKTYKITVRFTTAADRRVECEMVIKVKDE